ncbi:MAG: hypothetical protein HKM87_10190 [Ignavibacteriaceae bacterium]|nr:hypothetical protein [Ignavibacteriaceae bacterium]
MEDFFEIIIYLFIIISFISSFFKKKKKPQQKQQVPGSQLNEHEQIQLPVQKAEPEVKEELEIDIVKEFEKFFQVGTPQKKTSKEHNDKEIYEGAKDREGYTVVPEESFHKKTASEHTFIDPWDKKRTEVKKKVSKVDKSIEEQASKFEKHLKKKETAASEISKEIRTRLKDPSSLKDYIIISEIMGKPKSLSRRAFF